MKLLKSHEKVFVNLFDSDENLLRTENNPRGLTPAELEVKKRCMIIYSLKITDPLISDADVIEKIKQTFDVKEWTIYNDIRAVEHYFLGSFKKANKEYIRHIVNESQKEVLSFERNRLRDAKEKDKYYNSKPLSSASKVLADANALDKEDTGIDRSQYTPPIFEFTSDVEDIEMEDMPEEEVEKLKQKYLKNNIEEAVIIEDDGEKEDISE